MQIKHVCRVLGLACAALVGCVDAPGTARPAEPIGDDSLAVAFPASAGTSAALGIAQWRWTSTDSGVIVRGLDAADAPLARFWLAPGEAADEQIAYSSDSAAELTVHQGGALEGDNAALRTAVAAFRADVEAAHAAHKAPATEHFAETTLCIGQSHLFGSAPFWGTTTVSIRSEDEIHRLRFSFQPGFAYEEVTVWPADYAALYRWVTFTRQWAGALVTIKYITPLPNDMYSDCHTIDVY